MLGQTKALMRRFLHPAGWLRRWEVTVLVLLLLVVIVVGTWLVATQTAAARHHVVDDLASISHLKVRQIETWRTERLRDASSLAGNAPFAQVALRFAESGDAADEQMIRSSLEARSRIFDYYQAALVDRSGRTLLGIEGYEGVLATDALGAIERACAERVATMTDLHSTFDDPTLHLDTVAAIVPPDGSEPTLCVLLRAKATAFLFPELGSWPVTSESAETLLVRRDGDEVVFLNGYPRLADPGFGRRAPLGDPSSPVTAAALGQQGVIEGPDQYGVTVLASVEAVPDTTWYVIAKVDSSEALGPVSTRTAVLGALIGLLVIGIIGAAIAYRQHNLKKGYASAYAESLASRSLLERYQYLVQEAQDAIFLADTHGRIIEVNDRASQLYGYSREEFLERRFEDMVPPDSQAELLERLKQAKAGVQTTHELIAMRKDGSRFPIEVSDKVFSVDGEPLTEAIIRDISHRRRSEEQRLDIERQLQHSQRLESLGVLAGGIAHDFNNILTTILGHADLALHDMPLSSPGRRGVQEIVGASRRAADLCQQMLAYSGRGQFIIEDIDLRALIEDMLNLFRSSIPKTVLLNLNLAKNLPRIRGDVSQVNQIVMNLVLNAAEAIGERSGVITISTGAQECPPDYFRKSRAPENLPGGLYVTLEVSDTGTGMDRRTLDQIFEPFFTTKFTGRGLGLSAVLGIVRGHKGGIVVYSEPGKGSTFKVLLPAVETTLEAKAQIPADELEWRGQGVILLADDEETIRALGKMMLERLGFEVLLASDGREAVALFKEHLDRISAVLLDLTMPHMNGEEAFRAMRDLKPGVQVILCSGYSEAEISARFAGKGPAGFLQKPYTLATLTQRLQSVFD